MKKDLSSADLLKALTSIIEDKKAENITAIDVSGKTLVADYLLIASANSSRQLYALSEYIAIYLKSIGILPSIDGAMPCDWVVVDALDVVVHLFKPESRKFYNLEKMWSPTMDENAEQN